MTSSADHMPHARPASLRAACLRRFILVAVVVAVVIPPAAIRSRDSLAIAHRELEIVRLEGDRYLATIARRAELRSELRELDAELARRSRTAESIPASAVIATLINRMPQSMSFEHIDVSQRPRAGAPSNAGAAATGPGEPAWALTIDLWGVASDESAIDSFLAAVGEIHAFDRPVLHETSERTVRGHPAVGFEISVVAGRVYEDPKTASAAPAAPAAAWRRAAPGENANVR